MKQKQQIPRVLIVLSRVQKACRDKIAGILRYVHQHTPWDVQILDNHPHAIQLEQFGHWQPDGIIFDLSFKNIKCNYLHHIITSQSVPSVIIDGTVPWQQPAVQHDSYLIAEAAADHLLKRGIKHFAYIGSAPHSPWSTIRATTFDTKVTSAGHKCYHFTPDHNHDWALEQQLLLQWLINLPKPCGIMAAYDLRAKQILDTCHLANISVPGDISVVGVDNDITICENTTPTLSSVLPDFESGGYLAAELLADLLKGNTSQPSLLTYGVHSVVQRRSSMYFNHASAQLITSALEFIRLNACSGITVIDVASHLNLSRRYLERLFRSALNRSVLDEIQKHKLAGICTLLRETNTPITEVGHACGYNSDTYIKTLFKKRFGMTMRDYRKQIVD